MKPTHVLLLAAIPILAIACATGVNVQGFSGGTGGVGGDDTSNVTGVGNGNGTGNGVGTGGSATSSGASMAMSSSSTGVPATCTMKSDCAGLDSACNTGNCLNNVCVAAPANEGAACDDGLFCTELDVCQMGVCVGVTPKVCPSTGACNVGSCDEATKSCGSAPGNDGASCDDGDACTETGTCGGGVCVPGAAVDCSALDTVCGTGICDPMLGCQAMPKNNGTACDDGLYCTINDECKAGVCAGVPNTCAPPGDVCMVGVCTEASKSCVASPGNNGVACSDGNPCHVSAHCSAGVCANGVAGNAGVACDDGNACTTGTTCSNGVCGGATMTINQCINGDMCCPANCPNDSDCLWWQSGVQQNVAPATMTGWTQCFSQTYDKDIQPSLPTIMQQCSKSKLLMACRKVGAPIWQLAAMGLRTDVLFDCGSTPTCTHQANGVGWYYSASFSWGFVNGADAVERNECDTDAGPLRLCWHTLGGFGGYRCGDTTGLNDDTTWERGVFDGD